MDATFWVAEIQPLAVADVCPTLVTPSAATLTGALPVVNVAVFDFTSAPNCWPCTWK